MLGSVAQPRLRRTETRIQLGQASDCIKCVRVVVNVYQRRSIGSCGDAVGDGKMGNWILGLCVSTVCMLGCAPSAQPSSQLSAQAFRPFQFARVALADMTIGLAKPDGRPWDGPSGSISPEDARVLALALGATEPFAAVSSVLMRPAVQAMDKPEVKGYAALYIGAARQPPQTFRAQRDTMHPMLQPQPVWEHVPLDGSARIEVNAVDDDVAFDDPIGTFFVGADALAAGANSGTLYQFNVANQTQLSVLFVGISVIPE